MIIIMQIQIHIFMITLIITNIHNNTHNTNHNNSTREFKDVVFEDVVFDNNRFDIDVTLQNNI